MRTICSRAIRAQKDLVLVPTPGVPSRTIAYRDNASLVEAPSNFEFLSPGDRDFVLSTARKDLGGAEPARAARAAIAAGAVRTAPSTWSDDGRGLRCRIDVALSRRGDLVGTGGVALARRHAPRGVDGGDRARRARAADGGYGTTDGRLARRLHSIGARWSGVRSRWRACWKWRRMGSASSPAGGGLPTSPHDDRAPHRRLRTSSR
jgi:hypothetical protein